MRRFFFALVILIVVTASAPGVIGTPSGTPTPTGTDTPTATAGEVRSLLNESGSLSQANASRVYAFVRSGGLKDLRDGENRDLLRRLLRRGGNESVPGDVLGASVQRVGTEDARTILGGVRAQLPERQSNRLATLLELSDLNSLLEPEPTPTPTASTPGPSGSNTSQVVAQVGSQVQVIDWEYNAGDGEMVVTLSANLPTTVTVSDALGPISDEGASEIPQKSVVVDGIQTVRMQVTEYRGSAAVGIATTNGAVYVSTGISEAGNPFEGGSPTVGWIGGASLAVLMFVLAGVWKLRRESTTPRIAKQGPKRGENK